MRGFLLRLPLALLAGTGMLFVSPPWSWVPLHGVLWAPLLASTDPAHRRRDALLGYIAGWWSQLLIYWWLIETIERFSSLPWALGFAVLLLFATVFALPYALLFGVAPALRARIGLAWVPAFAAMQAGIEQVWPHLFPYAHGVTLYRTEGLWQLVSVTGVTGLTFVLMASNALLAELGLRLRERSRLVPAVAAVAGFVAVVGALHAWGLARLAAVEARLAAAPVVQMAVLQQNVTMETRLDESALDSLKSWVNLTTQAIPQKPDLVVWPEGAVTFNPNSERPAKVLGDRSPRQFFEEMARNGGFDFVVGGGTIEVVEDGDRPRFAAWNSDYFFSREGGLQDRYDKMVPLPFGEYIPLSDTFPFLKSIIQGPGDFRKGTRPTLFTGRTRAGHDYRFTTPICYEAILDRAMEPLFQPDPAAPPVDLFVVITNDAWFGDTASPHQHAMLTAVQAMQLGRPLARLAYTGVSWVVEPHGRIVGETTPFTEVVALAPIRLAAEDTLFLRGGWLFPWACALFAAGATLVAAARARRAPG
jgi:apolipoprotein N-acyltransferase